METPFSTFAGGSCLSAIKPVRCCGGSSFHCLIASQQEECCGTSPVALSPLRTTVYAGTVYVKRNFRRPLIQTSAQSRAHFKVRLLRALCIVLCFLPQVGRITLKFYKLLGEAGNASTLWVLKGRAESLSCKGLQSCLCLGCRPGVGDFSESVISGRAVILFTLAPKATRLHCVCFSFFLRDTESLRLEKTANVIRSNC